MKNPLPMPFGWFMIGYSDELAPGEVRNVHYFDRDMVLYRTESGELGLTDPYCPHLGAHLGHGGEVVGESIRCPFHHWSYDTKGVITDIPYAKQIPPKVQGKPCLKTYHVQEKARMIWAWFHPDDTVNPLHDVADIPEASDPEWINEIDEARLYWKFDSCPQEIAENGVDAAHFKYVHGYPIVPEGDAVFDGVNRKVEVFADDEVTLEDGTTETQRYAITTIIQHGAGQKWVLYNDNKGFLYVLIICVTPINKETCEFRYAFLRQNTPEGSDNHKQFLDVVARHQLPHNVEGDIAIWDKKAHLEKPILCDGDGAIMKFRKYFVQFYAEDNIYDGEPEATTLKHVS